nr:MAG: hypothetical protein [Bacteriophage sp.]
MNKEINTIIANLEGCIGMFDYLLTPTESKLLVLYIEELQQENKQLKDNWNKLREYIGIEWYSYDNESVECEVAGDILDKMQELQGSGSDE